MPRIRRIDDHAERLSRHFTVTKPEGEGPFPVVVQLHGCGGRQPFHDTYAEAALAIGVASVIVDSFTPRRISKRAAQISICTGLRLRGAERSADLIAALHWLEQQDWVDLGRIAVAGWSHGGWTIMDALAGAARLHGGEAEALACIKAAILIYPYAGPPSLTAAKGWGAHKLKVSAIVGTKDRVVGQAMPRRALDRLKRDGLEVEVLTLDGATHSFDDPDAEDPRTRYNPQQSARARAFFTEALQAAFA